MRSPRFIFAFILLFALAGTSACAKKEPPRKSPPVRIEPAPRKSQTKVDDACMQRCMTRNAMRSIGAEQIEYDCELDCRVK